MSEYSPSQPPGWYYAQGDPPGTQRYWDGAQWVGGPQAAQGAEAGLAGYGQAGGAGVGVPASWGTRFVAYLIDYVIAILAVVVVLVLTFVFGAASDALGAIVLYLGVLIVGPGYFIWNFLVKQGQTGQTIGKAQQRIKLVDDATGQPVGVGKAFLRYLVIGLLGALCGIPALLDVFWPLWDEQQKRLTDKMLNLSVVSA